MLNVGFALLLQLCFNSPALPMLTCFRSSIPAFSHSFALLQRLCFFWCLVTCMSFICFVYLVSADPDIGDIDGK